MEELGSGLFGKVYKVQHKTMPKLFFALKRMEYRAGWGMEKEAAAMTVFHHRNVVKFLNHRLINIAGVEYLDILMELCEDGTLSGWCDNPRRNENWGDQEFQMRIFRQIVYGVKYIHEKRISHGDLHAKNILMVNPDSYRATAKICDFGNVNDIHKTNSFFHTTGHLLKTCGDKVWWRMFVIDWMERKTVSSIFAQDDDVKSLALIFITLRNALSGVTAEESGMCDEDRKVYNAMTKDGCTAEKLMQILPRRNRRKRKP